MHRALPLHHRFAWLLAMVAALAMALWPVLVDRSASGPARAGLGVVCSAAGSSQGSGPELPGTGHVSVACLQCCLASAPALPVHADQGAPTIDALPGHGLPAWARIALQDGPVWPGRWPRGPPTGAGRRT